MRWLLVVAVVVASGASFAVTLDEAPADRVARVRAARVTSDYLACMERLDRVWRGFSGLRRDAALAVHAEVLARVRGGAGCDAALDGALTARGVPHSLSGGRLVVP